MISLAAASLAALLGLTLALQWQRSADSPLLLVMAHGLAGLIALLALLIAPTDRSSLYSVTIAALTATIALGILMLLMRDRQNRRPGIALVLHIIAAVVALGLLVLLLG